MHVRKQLLAAGSTATLVAGGLFFSAAPASAVHDSPECVSAQSQFTAALHNAELNAELEVELAVALQNLLDAQETLDLLEVEGAATLEDIELRITAALLDVQNQNLPNFNAIINAEGGLNSAVGQAQLLLDAALAGNDLDAAALLELGINLEDFLLDAEIDVAALTDDLNAAVTAEALTKVEADGILADVEDDGILEQTSIDLLVGASIEVVLLEREVDRAALAAALSVVIDDLNLEITTVTELIALLESGDLTAILDAEAQLEALLGVDLDLSALVNLETELFAALAILEAQANLDAAIAVVNGLAVELDALDVDLLELEALFAAAIEACTGAAVGGGVVGGGDNDNDYDDDHDNGAGGTGGAVTTGGGTGGTGGTNRGMNVQTAVPTASTDPAGIGALAAGIGFLVVAGTMAARRVHNS